MTQTELMMPPRKSEQAAQIERVGDRIAGHVLAFCRSCLAGGAPFYMTDLTSYVRLYDSAAPDSAGRILRSLRQRGLVGYRVISRAESLYLVEWVK